MDFIKGMELSERYYKEVIFKILKNKHRELKHTAGLIGPGSEVLGFDTKRSMDHDWGLRVMIFLKEEELIWKKEIEKTLQKELPKDFLGYPTNFRKIEDGKVRVISKQERNQPINHGIEITTIKTFFKSYLGIDPYKEITNSEWLLLSEHKLKTIRSGQLFQDDLGLETIKKKLNYYPFDVWLYLLSSEWAKISQEESFMGRCGEAGDELGSRIISVRLIQSIINLVYLMNREYIPYSKWYGKAFSQLKESKELRPILVDILNCQNWKERESGLSKAYKIVGEQHNRLGITEKLSPEVKNFYNRPYKVIDAGRYVKAIRSKIEDEEIKKMQPNLGSINQITQTVEILEDNDVMRRMDKLYQ